MTMVIASASDLQNVEHASGCISDQLDWPDWSVLQQAGNAGSELLLLTQR